MAITKWIREFPSAVSSPVNLIAGSTSPADWLQLPNGGDVTITDQSGNVRSFTGLNPQDVIRCEGAIRTIQSSTAKVRVGTGSGPVPAGPQGATGQLQNAEAVLAADGAANTAITETHLATITSAGQVAPWLHFRGAVTADDTNYATITFKQYRAGSVINTRTLSTTTTGLGSQASGAFTLEPTWSCMAGDHITYTQTKTGTGVQLPARSYGFQVTP